MLVVFLGALALSVVIAFAWPATYTSTGTILIEQQEVPAELVRSTISSYADQRIQVITQRVMTTENLLQIVQRFDLYASARRREGRESILERMRDDIRFEMISADVVDPRQGRPTKATIAFSVGYSSPSTATAAKVANELTSLYLQENLESRKQLTADTATFLSTESAKLSERISELESQLAEFKERHVNDLPELAAMNLQLGSRADDELRDIDMRLRSLDQQVTYLDAQLAQLNPTSQIFTSTGERVLSPLDRLKYLRTEVARASAIYTPDHPDVIRLKREMDGLQSSTGAAADTQDLSRQLTEAQSQLASARERYANDHPDVVRLDRLATALTARLGEARVTSAAPAGDPTADNPAYIQVKAQREAATNERVSLVRRRAEVSARSAEFVRRLATAPTIEQEYTSLTRELEGTQFKYREVRQKQMEAELAQNLESERKGERFTLIEPPVAAEEPSSPNRKLILALGLLIALGAAIGSMAFLEALDTRVRGAEDVERSLAVPPLAIVPHIETLAEVLSRTRFRRRALAGMVSGAILAVIAVHYLYRPLDVLWQVALRRLGV